MYEASAKKQQAKNETDPDKRAAQIKEAQDIEGTWGEAKPGRVGLHALIGGPYWGSGLAMQHDSRKASKLRGP